MTQILVRHLYLSQPCFGFSKIVGQMQICTKTKTNTNTNRKQKDKHKKTNPGRTSLSVATVHCFFLLFKNRRSNAKKKTNAKTRTNANTKTNTNIHTNANRKHKYKYKHKDKRTNSCQPSLSVFSKSCDKIGQHSVSV